MNWDFLFLAPQTRSQSRCFSHEIEIFLASPSAEKQQKAKKSTNVGKFIKKVAEILWKIHENSFWVILMLSTGGEKMKEKFKTLSSLHEVQGHRRRPWESAFPLNLLVERYSYCARLVYPSRGQKMLRNNFLIKKRLVISRSDLRDEMDFSAVELFIKIHFSPRDQRGAWSANPLWIRNCDYVQRTGNPRHNPASFRKPLASIIMDGTVVRSLHSPKIRAALMSNPYNNNPMWILTRKFIFCFTLRLGLAENLPVDFCYPLTRLIQLA